ncbi:MAG TPA: phenylalanine--tRNA ligase subunit beta, partial [Thermomicrobiales bacterium]|nr:phenylalanine--tRNA ligase subunit beta [Thermomicrobiales bacterium]
MKVPYRWLKDYVATNLSPEELARRMTMAGLEAEKLTRIGDDWNNVFVGEVIAVNQHPDADRLVLADVEAGVHRLTVVTGAPNIAAGQKVALALAGARLIDGYSEELKYKTLKPGTIRGVKSEGMVCSEKELGISGEHEGILVLEPDAPAGVPLAEYLGDTVIEFEITPNLVHAFSVFGIAREAGAIVDAPVTPPNVSDLSTIPGVTDMIRIDAPDLCRRYHAIVIDGVEVAPSPAWMARRLTHAGVRPVNNLVDVTNYVMLELGQPLHAFDLSFVEGEQIIVRAAEPGECMETLDHRERELDGGEILICDAVKPIGLAGVMGGVNSEIVDSTTSILLEAANFDMVSIRRTARAQKLQTDASSRFGRGIDPELAGQANARTAQLVLELCPNARIRCTQDVYPNPPVKRTLNVPIDSVESILGMQVEPATMVSILERLGFDPQLTGGDVLHVSIPSWRSDVSIKEDIVEEVARVEGYDALPATLIVGTTPLVERDATYIAERLVREILVASGAYEGRGYVTMSEADIERWSLNEQGGLGHALGDVPLVRLRNAIPADDDILRPSILPRLVASVASNLKHERTVRLFEIGHVYLGTDPDLLPREPSTIGIAFAGFREPFDRFNPRPDNSHHLDYFDVRGVIDIILDRFGLGDAGF